MSQKNETILSYAVCNSFSSLSDRKEANYTEAYVTLAQKGFKTHSQKACLLCTHYNYSSQ